MMARKEKNSSGMAVDASGAPAFDPTDNVLDKIEDLANRIDGVLVAAEKLSNVKHGHSKEIIKLHADYGKELRLAESNRLDAIRDVDAATAALREERADRTATSLANQVASTAETLRALVATTAAAAETAANAVTKPLGDRIAVLEKGSYEGSGKSAITDPLMQQMANNLEALRLNGANKTGRDGMSQSVLLTLMAAGGGLAVFLIENLLRMTGGQ